MTGNGNGPMSAEADSDASAIVNGGDVSAAARSASKVRVGRRRRSTVQNGQSPSENPKPVNFTTVPTEPIHNDETDEEHQSIPNQPEQVPPSH